MVLRVFKQTNLPFQSAPNDERTRINFLKADNNFIKTESQEASKVIEIALQMLKRGLR